MFSGNKIEAADSKMHTEEDNDQIPNECYHEEADTDVLFKDNKELPHSIQPHLLTPPKT